MQELIELKESTEKSWDAEKHFPASSPRAASEGHCCHLVSLSPMRRAGTSQAEVAAESMRSDLIPDRGRTKTSLAEEGSAHPSCLTSLSISKEPVCVPEGNSRRHKKEGKLVTRLFADRRHNLAV